MPDIFRTPELSAEDRTVIDLIDRLKARIRYATGSEGAPRRWVGSLRRNLHARAIQGSNAIEGINVTIDDAVAAIEGEDPITEKTEDWKSLVGYQRAMSYVLNRAVDPTMTYSSELLKGLHFMMLEHALTKNPGRWRPGAVYVRNEATEEVVYEGPDVEIVPGLIEALVQDLRADAEAPGVVRAAMAHLNLVMIHPFSDGNGRMARCLQSLVLARTGVLSPIFSSIEEYLGRNTPSYYEVLAEVGRGSWRPERDARPWVRFCLAAHYIQARTVARRIEDMHRLWDELEREVAGHGLAERCLPALVDAAIGLKVRNATYRGPAEVSDQVASNDLRALAGAGLLVPVGEKRGRFYVASPALLAIRQRTRTATLVRSPYDDLAEARRLAGLPESQAGLFPPG